jgi:hypothetical protein
MPWFQPASQAQEGEKRLGPISDHGQPQAAVPCIKSVTHKVIELVCDVADAKSAPIVAIPAPMLSGILRPRFKPEVDNVRALYPAHTDLQRLFRTMITHTHLNINLKRIRSKATWILLADWGTQQGSDDHIAPRHHRWR